MAPPTVISLKASFLSAQTRLLAQPLAPSRAWRDANDEAEDRIPERALDDALLRLNLLLQQHSRRVHALQATRHVAEQIDRLYWDVAERTVEQDGDDVGLKFDEMDGPEAIETLPPVWESERDVNAHPMEARRYSELVSRLKECHERKKQAERSVARLRQMKDLLEPFQADGEGRGVQENLITRGGEVEKELERMRMLLARVSGRVGHLLEHSGDGSSGGSGSSDLVGENGAAAMVDDVQADETRKVNDLLGRL